MSGPPKPCAWWPFAPDSEREVSIVFGLMGLGAVTPWLWPAPWTLAAGVLLLALGGLGLFFFRDPARRPPPGEDQIVAPADGAVVAIQTLREDSHLGGSAIRLSVFLSLFDVHVTRAPLTGTILYLLTLFNLGSAFYALWLVMHGHLLAAGALILVTALIDGMDGELARLLQAGSDFGLHLDSLADIVCFGVAPAMLMVRYLEDALVPFPLIGAGALVFLLSGGARLARFNVMRLAQPGREAGGLPITGAGGLLVLLICLNYQTEPLRVPPAWLPLVAIGLGLLMISRISFLPKSRRLTIAAGGVAILLSPWLTLPLAGICILSLHLLHGMVRAGWQQFRRWLPEEGDVSRRGSAGGGEA